VHGITIARVSGGSGLKQYQGVIAIIKDPAKVGTVVSSRINIAGQKLAKLCEDNDAILGINASGFEDAEGGGSGGIINGLLYSGGEKYSGTGLSTYKAVFFDYENRLHVGTWKKEYADIIRDGLEFKPILVANGEKVIEGTAGWGVDPRTAIAQTKDGTVLMMVIDGRQPGYSIGTEMGELADILMDYGAYQAINLDGGSSAIMHYNGRKITKPCGGNTEEGRWLPDAFVVFANRNAADVVEIEN
jgi:exopolysaccharide biosynthesis protein